MRVKGPADLIFKIKIRVKTIKERERVERAGHGDFGEKF